MALAGLAARHELRGEYRDGSDLLRPVVEAGNATATIAVTYASLQRRLGEAAVVIPLLDDSLKQTVSQVDRCHLHFGLGDLYDATGQYKQAFEHYRQGNLLSPGHFDPIRHDERVDGLIEYFEVAAFGRLANADTDTRVSRPVFIVGMPRSGTSLVEAILGAHPKIRAGGELDGIPDLVTRLSTVQAGGTPYPQCLDGLDATTLTGLATEYMSCHGTPRAAPQCVTDKLPANFLHLGLIALLFPAARVIHCTRDPADTALSCYVQNFSAAGLAFSRNLEHIAAYYGAYHRLMDHWREVLPVEVMDLRYEDLVADGGKWSRRLVTFAGLAWREECLQFHSLDRVVATASHAQVREPIYSSSVGRARNYRRFLGDLPDRLKAFA